MRRRSRLRVALLTLLIALPLLGGGWLWLRQSSLVSVQRVQISGVHGADAGAVRAALGTAALRMSTLDVNAGALRAAVAPFPVVREVRAAAQFPHGLRIEVVEQLPVAALVVGGSRTAVAADGVVLGPALLSGSLPSVDGGFEPAAGSHVRGASLLAALAVLGVAPAPLARLVERAFTGPQGLTLAMHGGMLVYFGDASRRHAKWLSLARVLGDPSSAGASYVDVRVPERPAAGFPAGVLPPASAGAAAAVGSSEPAGPTESTVASLAAGLTSGGGEASSPAASAPTAAAGALTSAGGEASPPVASAPTAAAGALTSGGGEAPPPVASAPTAAAGAPAASGVEQGQGGTSPGG